MKMEQWWPTGNHNGCTCPPNPITTSAGWVQANIRAVGLPMLLVTLILALAACGGTNPQPAATPTLKSATATVSPLAASDAIPTIRELPDEWQFLNGVFPKYVDVFGVNIFATKSAPDAKVLHASNVMAQYLDNDGDGEPDNPSVLDAMKRGNASLVMAATETEMRSSVFEQVPARFIDMVDQGQVGLQDLYGAETNPVGRFDASLEEVLHLIASTGYAQAYPDVFGERPGSTIAEYMDKARGGRFKEDTASDCDDENGRCALPPNGHYPEGAWYTYLDPTCDYACMVSEYFYWALTTIMGAQSDDHRCKDISGEWALCTAEQVKSKDPDIYNLLTDAQYALPATLPDGSYAMSTE